MLFRRLLVVIAAAGAWLLAAGPAAAQARPLIDRFNNHETIKVSEDSKSYKIVFDAYLDMTRPPRPIGPDFNLTTIHPKMQGWAEVSGWAESNGDMVKALKDAKLKIVFGLPYGGANVSQPYRSADLIADIAVDDNLLNHNFGYLKAIDTIAAFVAAEAYRLLEAGDAGGALELVSANQYVLRQCCDRIFFAEKSRSIELLTQSLTVLRDMMYSYRDSFDAADMESLATMEIPYLTPDRNHLFMPEADQEIAAAVLKLVIDERSGADPERFVQTFASLQSQQRPLTRFGAARRWRMISNVHGSLEASLDRLQLIYDDWWRRWRVQDYDPILAVPPQFERTNPVRYAAVIFSVQDLQTLFQVRTRLIVEVNGTAMAAALVAYHRTFGRYPDDKKMTYGQFIRKSADIDPYDRDWAPLSYLRVSGSHTVDAPNGRVTIQGGEALLWSLGQDNQDARCSEHSDDGILGDIMIWPPARAAERAQGLID